MSIPILKAVWILELDLNATSEGLALLAADQNFSHISMNCTCDREQAQM